MESLKEQLFNTEAYRGPREIVEVEGLEVEVRPPTFKLAERAADDESLKTSVEMMIQCVYDPKTGNQVFDKHDIERLLNASTHKGGMVMTLINAMNRLQRRKGGIKKEVEEEVKN